MHLKVGIFKYLNYKGGKYKYFFYGKYLCILSCNNEDIYNLVNYNIYIL
jgi:hypothetical protein